MLEVKQPIKTLRKQARNYGDKFQHFVEGLESIFTHFRQITFKIRSPEHLQVEKALWLAIIDSKSNAYHNGGDKEKICFQLSYPLPKFRKQIKAITNLKEDQIEKSERFLDQCLVNLNSINSSSQKTDLYLYYLTLSICEKKEEKNFIGKLKPSIYTDAEIEKLGKEINQKINFMDYERSDKQLKKSFSKPTEDQIYLMVAKQKFYLLYAKDHRNLSAIKVVESGLIQTTEIQKIFSKSNSRIQSSNEEPSEQKFALESKEESQLLFPTDISCSSCGNKFPEFDCLFWNYEYLCGSCAIDINVDTSNIPAHRLEKYCQQRGLNSKTFDIVCPECEGITTIRKYNPTNKPRQFTCGTCTKKICLQHKCNIYTCFCYCTSCNAPTLFVSSMKVNYCQTCRKRMCFNCHSLDKKFCNCICNRCLNENSPNHQCEPSCHFCLNSPAKLKNCRCGLYICYGCFNVQMQKDGTFECVISDYV